MATTQKQVKVIARIQFKNDPRKVVYLVRSSDGTSQFETTLFDGKATSCSCPSHCRCYHKTQLEQIESERVARQHEARTIARQSDSQLLASRFATEQMPAWAEAMVAKNLLSVPSVPIAKSLPEDLKGSGKVAKITDLSTKGILNGNRGYQLMRAG